MRTILYVALFILLRHAYAETIEAKVVRISDGDSLVVHFGDRNIRVRLVEIDAPEISQPFGDRSRASLTQICGNKTARISWSQKDRNDRLLARVWCNGRDANAEQVRRGMAWVFERYAKDLSLFELQTAARANRAGLWAEGFPIPPWEWRRLKGVVEYRPTRANSPGQ